MNFEYKKWVFCRHRDFFFTYMYLCIPRGRHVSPLDESVLNVNITRRRRNHLLLLHTCVLTVMCVVRIYVYFLYDGNKIAFYR